MTLSRPKTETSVRKVSIPQEAVDLLVAEHKKHPDNPYMFPSPVTGEMYYPDSIGNLHKKILKDAGLPHIRFHDLRHTFATLALQLVDEGKNDKARKVLEYGEKAVPTVNVPHHIRSGSAELASAWAAIGEKQKAKAILNDLLQNSKEYLDWYLTFSPYMLQSYGSNFITQLRYMGQCVARMRTIDVPESQKWEALLNNSIAQFEQRSGYNLGE